MAWLRREAEGSMGYRVKLNTFEGPFDLLVYLIEHAQMSVYDISISEITDQYMRYVADMKDADISVSSEFMVLAAALLEIKSKMLLPRSVAEDGTADIMEDPRTELVAKLVEYKRFKAISEMLEARGREAAMHLEKPQEDLAEYTGEPDEHLCLDLDKFKSAFELFLQRKKKLEEIQAHPRRSEKQRITTEARMESISDFFRNHDAGETNFKNLVQDKTDMYDVAVTFSSVLEMIKARRLDADQKYIFGDITVKATPHIFDAKGGAFADVQGDALGENRTLAAAKSGAPKESGTLADMQGSASAMNDESAIRGEEAIDGALEEYGAEADAQGAEEYGAEEQANVREKDG